MDTILLEKVNEANKNAFINLFNLYHNDLAEFAPDLYTEVDNEGFYDRGSIMNVLSYPESEVQTYIIKYMSRIAGLMVLSFPPFVKSGSDYCIQDIFILNNLRGKGIAKEACKKLFYKYSGRYSIQVLSNNPSALRFWDKLIEKEARLFERSKTDELLITYEFATDKNME